MAEKKNIALGERLQAERKKRGWDLIELAQRLRAASADPRKMTDIPNIVRNIERWEAGQVGKLQERWRLLYSTVFDIPDEVLFRATGTDSPVAETPHDEAMERRKLLQSLIALGAASSPAVEALHHIQSSVDRALGADDTLHLDEWEETVAEYGYAYNVQPPGQLLPDLAADLVAVRTIMTRAAGGDPAFRSWSRVSSGLSSIMAKVLSNLGQAREARTWWVTAQQAADVSGDADLSMWVGAERLVYGLYEHRPTPILLRRANDIAARATDRPCRGLAHISTVHSQLLALDGQTEAAREALRRSVEVFEQLPTAVTTDASISGWNEYRLRYTEAWVHAHLKDREGTDAAVTRAGQLRPSGRGMTQLGLLQAFGHVRAGDVPEGVAQAQEVYEANPVDQRTVMVTTLAGLVLDEVPASRLRDPKVVGYRELLASGARRSIT